MTTQSLPRHVPFAIHRKINEKEYIPIQELLDWNTRKSNWVFNKRFLEIEVAHFNGLTPAQWDAITSEECKAEMIAYYNMKSQMRDYENFLHEKQRKWKK